MQSATERRWSGILTFGDNNWPCQISLYTVTPHMIQPQLEFSDRPLRLSYISDCEDKLYLTPKIQYGTELKSEERGGRKIVSTCLITHSNYPIYTALLICKTLRVLWI